LLRLATVAYLAVKGEADSSIAQAAYFGDTEGVSNDFEIDPNPEHGFEIFNWLLISGSIQSVS